MDKVCCYCRYFEEGICHNKDSECYHTFNGYEDACDRFAPEDELIGILEGMKQ